MKTKKFYDIHFHAMDLSHANVTAFINRFLQEGIIGSLRKKKDRSVTLTGIICTVLNIPWYILRTLYNIIYYIVITIFAAAILLIIPNTKLANKARNLVRSKLRLDKLISKKNKSLNLLSFMESAIEYDFLVLEYFFERGKAGAG